MRIPRAQNNICWPGCPPDHQVQFSGCPHDFLEVRGHKKSIFIFQNKLIETIAGDLLRIFRLLQVLKG